MFGLGFGEVLVILVVALLVFGPDKLPELARTLGKTMAELRRSMDDMKTEFRGPIQDFERTLRSEPLNPQSAQNLGAPNVATPRLDSADVPKAPLTEVKIESAPVSSEKSTAEGASDPGNSGAEGSPLGGPHKGNVN